MQRKWQNWKFSCHSSHWWVNINNLFILYEPVLVFISTCYFIMWNDWGLILLIAVVNCFVCICAYIYVLYLFCTCMCLIRMLWQNSSRIYLSQKVEIGYCTWSCIFVRLPATKITWVTWKVGLFVCMQKSYNRTKTALHSLSARYWDLAAL